MKNVLTVFAIILCAQQVSGQQPTYDVTSGNGNGIRFWSKNDYKIHMGNLPEYHFGPVTSYSIKSNMSADSGRGWTWGVSGLTPIASLTNTGIFQIDNRIISRGVDLYSGNGNGIRFWSSNKYKIHMGNLSEYQYGPVTDFSIKTNMSNTPGRGWTWGAEGLEPVAAINTAGEMKIKGYFESANLRTTRAAFSSNKPGAGNSWVRDTWLTGNYGPPIWDEALAKWVRKSGTYNDVGGIVWQDEGTYFIREKNGSKLEYSNGEFLKTAFLFANISTGNVGIGTITPDEKLEVQGNIRLDNYSIKSAGNSRIDFGTAGLGNEDDDIGIYIEDNGELEIKRNGDHMLNISTHFNIAMPSTVKVGIGTTSPDEKLTVKGKIHTEEVRVDLSVPGPDYVFEPNYDLRTLAETEQYIQANKHLPEIPSAKEMETNGVELGVMNMLLLKKIEELTLYQIEMMKLIENQQKEIEKLKKD